MAEPKKTGKSSPAKSGTSKESKPAAKPAKVLPINLSAAKCISIHFSPGLIDLKEVEKRLKAIGGLQTKKPKMVIDAFLTPEQVKEKDLDPSITKMVKKLATKRLNFSRENGPARETLVTNIIENDAISVFVGPMKDGVLEEFNLLVKMSGGKGLKAIWI